MLHSHIVEGAGFGPVRMGITSGTNPYAGMSGLRLDSSRSIQGAARRILGKSGYLDCFDPRSRQDSQRADALTIAFARELEDIIKEVFEVEYPELRAREFIPERSISPEALSFAYRMTNRVGMAAIINENGSDIPKVDVQGKEFQQNVVTWGASYDFTILDQMRSGRLGISIDALKAEAARWACEYFLEQLAAVGNSATGLVGITNAPGIQTATQVSTGTWLAQIAAIGQATTTNATPPAVVVAQAICADVAAMKNLIFTGTEGIHTATDCLVPISIMNLLEVTPQSPGFNENTLLDFLEKTLKLKFNVWPQLNAADVSGTNGVHGMVVVYKKDPKVLNLMMAQQFTQLPPQQVKMAYEIDCYMRGGATQVRYPLAVATMKGLG
jgi:hypothetical protein